MLTEEEKQMSLGMQIAMASMGGLEGVKAKVNWCVPYAVDLLKELMEERKKEFAQIIADGGYNSVGYSLIADPKGRLAVIFFAYKFPKKGDFKVSFPLGEALTLQGLVNQLLDAMVEQNKKEDAERK